MRLHRFYVETAIEDKVVKIEEEGIIHQWKDVFRYLVGSQVIVFNGDGYDYLGMITELYNRTAKVEIVSRKKSIMPEKNIGLIMAIIKNDNMDMVIQKATELGVSKIFPIIAERSEKKSINIVRAKKIAIEASEQSGRGNVPEIFKPRELFEFLENEKLEEFEKKIIFSPLAEKINVTDITGGSFVVAIGPEGGFSDREQEHFGEKRFKSFSLGDLILRAETAAISALTILLLG